MKNVENVPSYFQVRAFGLYYTRKQHMPLLSFIERAQGRVWYDVC